MQDSYALYNNIKKQAIEYSCLLQMLIRIATVSLPDKY